DDGGTLEARNFSDEQIVERVCDGNIEFFEILLRRYNQRVYRTARSVLRNDAEAEEVAQEAWVRAFDRLSQFAGRGRFASWVTQIALREALSRARRGRIFRRAPQEESAEIEQVETRSDPEQTASGREIHNLIEMAIDALPEKYRLVFLLREVEGLSTREAAGSLKLSRVAVNTRLHRARALLRHELLARVGPCIVGSSRFLGRQCDRMTEGVMRRCARGTSVLVDPRCGTEAGT